ncbi:MAG: hypothetical protein DDT34_02536 [Firmicutes bacterium]|nr:hypothetical protein [Bacillota bacterium]
MAMPVVAVLHIVVVFVIVAPFIVGVSMVVMPMVVIWSTMCVHLPVFSTGMGLTCDSWFLATSFFGELRALLLLFAQRITGNVLMSFVHS